MTGVDYILGLGLFCVGDAIYLMIELALAKHKENARRA